jgi:hypothetical protein
MSEKGSTLDRGLSLSCEHEQRSEGRLILASIRNLNALPTEELASTRTGPKRWRPVTAVHFMVACGLELIAIER